MKINKEILRRAQTKNKAQDYIDQCLRAEICPECGKALRSGSRPDGHGGMKTWYKCDVCNYYITRY